jgi:hypothetical protein
LRKTLGALSLLGKSLHGISQFFPKLFGSVYIPCEIVEGDVYILPGQWLEDWEVWSLQVGGMSLIWTDEQVRPTFLQLFATIPISMLDNIGDQPEFV